MHVKRFDSFELYHTEMQKFASQDEDVYPFQLPWYQRVFAQHFCKAEDIYWLGVYEGKELVAAGVFEKVEGKLLFLGMKPVLGEEEVTDYGDIVIIRNFKDQPSRTSEVWTVFLAYFEQLNLSKIQLDYVRKDSSTYQYFYAANPGDGIEITAQEVAPYIPLPSTWDEYLVGMKRKYRKELRRKIRRLETEQAFHVCKSDTYEQDFEDFIRLHRLSDPAKNQFMTDKMKAFFWDLTQAAQKPWGVHFCFLELEKMRVAAVMTFQTESRELVYNSGYDPDYQFYAVGFVLKAFVVKEAIESGKKTADWLRGDERYKYDLGSRTEELYKICLCLP